MKDLITAVTKLELPLPEREYDMMSSDHVKSLIEAVEKASKQSLQSQINESDKFYLIHGRKERTKDGSLAHITSTFRQYLEVKIPAHRASLTSIILSHHSLAVARLRWVRDKHNLPIPREKRLCRFCTAAVETPEHALLQCTESNALVELRHNFLAQLEKERAGTACGRKVRKRSGVSKVAIREKPTINLVAWFAHGVLQIYNNAPIFDAAQA